MGDSKLCLLLLLSTVSLAFSQDRDHPSCLLGKRYKTLHKYQYLYETESLNAINGASQLQNGPKGSCKVIIEVPQTCSFVIRTTRCSLSEVVDMDTEGNPVFGPAPGSPAFAAEMEKYPLKFAVEGVHNVKLFPEEGETTTILNIKRGIVSALLVPLEEEDKNKNMPTIYGTCKTRSTVNARQTIATDISLTRDLSKCDRFVPMRDHTSPLAVISGMHYPLAQLIRSSQTCNYKFDNNNKHMTSGSCTENHILVPFSTKGRHGVTNVGKQTVTLLKVSPHNDRIFDSNEANVKGLHMEAPEDKTAMQDMDPALALLRELATLPDIDGERRAHLFQKLVTMIRGMKAETLSRGISEALDVSRALTFQVLAQCGTPECSSGLMQILRTYDSSLPGVDAAMFTMGLVSNPSPLLINDMLQMAKHKPSKSIMFALSNVVKKFYKTEGKLIPEIYSVAEFIATQLGDCTGDKDQTFMILRVIGNMAAAMGEAGPALRTGVIQCVNEPGASVAVQQAAIQVFRLAPLPVEGRKVLMQVVLDSASPVQKRIAAYLVLMKEPQPSELVQLAAALPNEQDQQAKSFIISHITNILSSTEPETRVLREKILDALQGNEIGTVMDPTKFSRNYKMGSVEGNMIFEGTSYLPKEIMLEMTLKSFGYDLDMEMGMEGKGLEPTVEALFGENGFFPDTAMKTMYFVSDNMPLGINEVLKSMMPTLSNDWSKKQASQGLMREIGRNLNKLVRELKTQQSPEAMVYLRLLGNELGYLRTNDMEELAYSAAMMIDSMIKMFPAVLIKAITTRTGYEIFAHYIFMDNKFFLPTATGMPLRIALSGTFTPGIKGGLKMAADMSEGSFMPSAGIEFVTQVGSHIPEYVNSGLEMHTNLFHESGLEAKLFMGRDHVKMSIPAPKSPTKLISISNTLVAVTGTEVKTIPPMVKDMVDKNECTPFFGGMKYCNVLQYTDASSHETAPYFPLTGDSKFAVELHPTGDVTEYTATIGYELLREGEDGRQKVDSVKMTVRAEGVEPMEARATVKYNRRKHVVTTNVQVPDYDVEAGFRLGVIDDKTKSRGTHSIFLDLINKNIPQLSLVGRANLKDMMEGMLQVQLLVPSIKADATVTTKMKHGAEMEFQLESEMRLLDTTSEQKLTVKYDGSKIEAEVKSDIYSEILNVLPHADMIDEYVNTILDMRVGQTDMKVRHILTKSVEATNNYMEKYASDVPYIKNFRVPSMPEISLPEKLFLNFNTKAAYHLNNEHFTLAIPVPLGGKSTKELNFPPSLTTPRLSMPQFGLEIASTQIPIPALAVPERVYISVPLFGKAEVSTVMKSNLYDLEASGSVGKHVVETPSYSAMFDVKATSPIDVLSFRIEGSGMLANTESMKAQLKGSLTHTFIEANINIVEDGTVTDKINLKSSSKFEATSPFDLNVVLEHTGMFGFNAEEISSDSNFVTTVKAGPFFGSTTSTQYVTIFPFRPEAQIDSSIRIDSTVGQVQNNIAATFINGELSVKSNTNAFEDFLTHVVKLSFKEHKLSLKCDTDAIGLGMKIHNQVQASAGAGAVLFNMETKADHSENRIHSLLTGTFDVNGLAVNSDANVKLLSNEATHKAILKMNEDGLVTSGKTIIKSPLTFENTFSAGLDASKATVSINNKASLSDSRIDNANTLTITLSSLDFISNLDAFVTEQFSYAHGIIIDLKPYTASAVVNNNFKVMDANLINEAELKAEPFKMDLTGSLKAIYLEEEIKHTYQVKYVDLKANAKCSTTGKLFGTQMTHNTELEVAGPTAWISNNARFNSQPMRFDHTIRASLIPFDFNLDAIFSADGDIALYGSQTTQIFGKFLLKAQPLAFACSHEYRASVTHKMDNGFSMQTTIDNKMDTVLSPQDQKTNFRMKSKVNDHAFNQDISMYNTAERIGMEVSGTIFTNILNTVSTKNQEFTISGFLKYDKNANSHVIQIPLIENAPAFVERIRVVILNMAEALQDYIKNEENVARLEALLQHVSDFVEKLDIERQVIQLKQYLTDFTQEYTISMEDLEASLEKVTGFMKRLLADLATSIQGYFRRVKEMVMSSTLSETVIQYIQHQMTTFNEMYDIKSMIVPVMDTIMDLIEHTDLEKLKGSSLAFLHNIDGKYEIKAWLAFALRNLKECVENVDMSKCVTFISSINFEVIIMELIAEIPTEMFTGIMTNVWRVIEDFDFLGQVNIFHAKMRELMVKMEIDKIIKDILDGIVGLVKEFRIEETIQTVVKKVKFMQINGMDLLKSKLEELHLNLEDVVQLMKSFNYNTFVDEANRIIAMSTLYVNNNIMELEIPQKLDATIDFVNIVLSSVRGFMERLREIKVSEMVKTLKEVFDHTVVDTLKKFAGILKEAINEIDVKASITSYLQIVSQYYSELINIINNIFTNMHVVIQKVASEQMIIDEFKQIIEVIITELRKLELDIPPFTVPFTDLVIPSMKFRMDKLHEVTIPTELDIPQFNVMGFYTVTATTISFDEIKHRIIELINLIVNLESQMLKLDEFFGDITINYFPAMPEITLPKVNFKVSIPALPKIGVEKLVETLQIPEIKLPSIPSEIIIPCFGRMYGVIKFHTPIYSFNTSAEINNSTVRATNPQFSGFINSVAKSPSFEILNFKLDSTARLAFPRRSRVVFAETLKLNHDAFGFEHQGSVNFYGQSAQAQAGTTMKVTTVPYTASIVNKATIAMEGGMTASVETNYNHIVNLPTIDFTSDVTLTQKATAEQEGTTIKVKNVGTAKLDSHADNHKSDLHLIISPSHVKLTFSSDTDTGMLKMKQEITAESAIFSYFQFNARSEANSPAVKNSLFEASGNANLYDMKVEFKANHVTELSSSVSGVLSNTMNFLVRPVELVFDFQNKANTKINIFETITAKMDLQNDYSAMFKTDSQHINTMGMARFNQYKAFYNFTAENNEKEANIFAAVDGEANLDFLMTPISIPELDLPFVDFHTPAISDINLYEQSGLKSILTTTEQSTNMDVKIVYHKSQGAPIVNVMDVFRIYPLGNIMSEVSVKSSIINMNVNAGLYSEDDFVLRLGATTVSIFEPLKAKLDGTISLTTKRGIKLANSLSLENPYIKGTHDSTIGLNTESFEITASVVTNGKIATPILKMEANQNLVADTKTKANAVSTLKLKGDFNVPMIKAVGKVEADNSLTLEGNFAYVSMESTTKANFDCTVIEHYVILGVLDNEATLYMNEDGIRTTSKFISDAKIHKDSTKVIGMDVNENLAFDASLSRVYAVLKFTENNDINLFTFKTKGKHIIQATIDLAPTSSLTADIEIDLSQPSNIGELRFFEKTVVDMTVPKQKISVNGRIVTPVYTTNMAVEVNGDCPIFKVTFKSSATSPIVFLEYDIDASSTANFGNEALMMNNKAVLTHTDVTMDFNHVIKQAFRRKRQANGSVSRHTLNVDIISPTFTDLNFGYAAARDEISASVSTPSTGYLFLQLNSRVPSQMSLRLYTRHDSFNSPVTVPENDVNILVIRTVPKDDDNVSLQITYNMDALIGMLSGLQERIPSISSAFITIFDKYTVTRHVEELKNTASIFVEEAYDSAMKYNVDLSQISILFRNVIVQYQKTVQVVFDAARLVLRETQFKLPGSEEMTTLPKVVKELTSTITVMLEKAIQTIYENMEVYLNSLVENIRSVKLQMPISDAINVGQILDQAKTSVKTTFDYVLDFVKNIESLDTMLEKLGKTLRDIVMKSQAFVDSINSDYLDAFFLDINIFYRRLVSVLKNAIQYMFSIDMAQVDDFLQSIIEMFITVVRESSLVISGFLQQTPEETSTYMKFRDGWFELDLPFTFQQ